MEILGALKSLLSIMATFAPTIVARIVAADEQQRKFFENVSDSVQDADKLVDLAKQIEDVNTATDDEYKRRGL